MNFVVSPRVFAVLLCLLPQQPTRVAAQARPLTVRELTSILESDGDTPEWDEFAIPEFIAAAYGVRVKDAILEILAQPSTRENYSLQVDALTTAQYGRVGVPTSVIMNYATGAKGREVGGVLRHRAMRALSMRPDPGLRDFWLRVIKDPGPSFRQLGAAGLSCALGAAALPYLASLRSDPSPSVSGVADFYVREHTQKGAAALACGGRVSRDQASTFPLTLRPSLRRRGEPILRRIP